MHKFKLDDKVTISRDFEGFRKGSKVVIKATYAKSFNGSYDYSISLDGRNVYAPENALTLTKTIKAYCFDVGGGDLIWRSKDSGPGKRKPEFDMEKDVE